MHSLDHVLSSLVFCEPEGVVPWIRLLILSGAFHFFTQTCNVTESAATYTAGFRTAISVRTIFDASCILSSATVITRRAERDDILRSLNSPLRSAAFRYKLSSTRLCDRGTAAGEDLTISIALIRPFLSLWSYAADSCKRDHWGVDLVWLEQTVQRTLC